jgi:hypothetical protein
MNISQRISRYSSIPIEGTLIFPSAFDAAARRRVGVKNGVGAARDVVLTVVR